MRLDKNHQPGRSREKRWSNFCAVFVGGGTSRNEEPATGGREEKEERKMGSCSCVMGMGARAEGVGVTSTEASLETDGSSTCRPVIQELGIEGSETEEGS